jgi:Fe2+ or Zn2+ uptake regulation protein
MQLTCNNASYCYGVSMKTARVTKAKQLITHIFETTPEPMSLQDLFRAVRISLPATAYSTVFRIVSSLEAAGKVKRVDWRERGSRYEWALFPHHHHIVCQLCGKIADLADADVNYDEKKIKDKTGYITKHHSIELEGICQSCQRKK